MTAAEYLRLPESFPRTQLIDGEIVVSEASPRHQAIVTWLIIELGLWTRGGEARGRVSISVDTRLNDLNVACPDIWWSSEANSPGPKGFLDGAVPELVVEVLSPSTRRYDLGVKRARYEKAGVTELWFVDPAIEQVTVLRRVREGFDDLHELTGPDVLTSPLLPDFDVTVSDLFAR